MMSLILGKKHTKLLIFNIKSDCGLDFFLLLSQSWACPRLGKTLALMHFLFLSRIRFKFFLPHLLFVAVFAPLTSIITTFFDCKAMTPYYHVFLIVGGFPCWEEIKLDIFTVDHEVAQLTL